MAFSNVADETLAVLSASILKRVFVMHCFYICFCFDLLSEQLFYCQILVSEYPMVHLEDLT